MMNGMLILCLNVGLRLPDDLLQSRSDSEAASSEKNLSGRDDDLRLHRQSCGILDSLRGAL